MWWRGCQAASRCHQNRIGPETGILHHHRDLAGGQTTQGRLTSHHSYVLEETGKDRRERGMKTSFREKERDMSWGWTPAGWGIRSNTSGNGINSQWSRAVPGWVLVQQEMPETHERRGGENRERRERGPHSLDAHVLVEQTNRRLERCNGDQNSCSNQ